MTKINITTLVAFLGLIVLGNYSFGGFFNNFKEIVAQDEVVGGFLEEDTTADCELGPGASAKVDFEPTEVNIYSDYPDDSTPISYNSPNSISSINIPYIPTDGSNGGGNNGGGGGNGGGDETTTVTPEPATIAIFAAVFGLVPLYRRRKR